MLGSSLFSIITACACALVAGVVRAGGSPASTAVVIDAHSTLSLAVGLRYAELRGIPSANLLLLEGLDGAPTLSFEHFLERIERPLRAFLAARPTESKIDTVALSVDLPFGVELAAHSKGRAVPEWVTPRASSTGLLYLAGFHDLQTLDWFALDSNPYARAKLRSEAGGVRVELETIGRPFRESTTEHEVLVVALGWIGVRGNQIGEIGDGLERTVAADGTQPDGTVYLMEHGDIRSRTRQPYFEGTLDSLKEAQRKAAILRAGIDGQDGVLPQQKSDVFGLLAGVPDFDWQRSGSRLLPGAIAEHLTSFGAAFDQPGQTKISSFLRAGAAGSAGAVYEPYALAPKFPHPLLHAYYAQGFSLAESFYLSVASPYQLLIVGDPLAQPMGRMHAVSATQFAGECVWRESFAMQIGAAGVESSAWAANEFWCDGLRIATSAPDHELAIDVRALGLGGHEVHAVVVRNDAARTRSSARRVIEVRDAASEFQAWPQVQRITWGHNVALKMQHSRAERMELWRGEQRVQVLERRAQQFRGEFSSVSLGPGTSWLHLRAFDGEQLIDRSALQKCIVVDPEPAPAVELQTPLGWLPGLRAQCIVASGSRELGVGTLALGEDRGLLERLNTLKEPVSEVLFEGEIQLDAGWNQLRLLGCDRAELEVAGFHREGTPLCDHPAQRWCGLVAAGWHRFRLRLHPSVGGAPALFVQGSGDARWIEGAHLRHAHPNAKRVTLAHEITVGEQSVPELLDRAATEAVTIDTEQGLLLRWKQPVKKLSAVVLRFPEGQPEARPEPSSWSVEVRTTSRGKWIEVKNLRAVSCPALGRVVPPHQASAWISLEFDPIAARELRLRPVISDPQQLGVLTAVVCFEADRR